MRLPLRAVSLALAIALAGPALAQDAAMKDHSDMTMPDGLAASASPDEMSAAMRTMMQAMDVAPTGDPDIDFARGMLAHHEGAVAMSKVLLGTGRDPEMLALARDIVGAQEAEIDQMREWLARHDK